MPVKAPSLPPFGIALKDLALAGQPPVVLLECLRFLAHRGGLQQQGLFNSPVDRRQLLALKELFESGRKALRGARAAAVPPSAVANLLLLWLSALPEPLFPPELLPALLQAYHASLEPSARSDRIGALRRILKRCDAYVVEAIFPLFELLHHFWVNQRDREASLEELATTFAGPVFGAAAEHRAPPELAAALFDATALLIVEYRPLFTQPYNLNRYQDDLARQEARQEAAENKAAAATTAAAAADQRNALALQHHHHRHQQQQQVQHHQLSMFFSGGGASPPSSSSSRDYFTGSLVDTGSPLLTPRRLGALSIFSSFVGAADDVDDDDATAVLLMQQQDPELEAVVSGLLEFTVASIFRDSSSSSRTADDQANDKAATMKMLAQQDSNSSNTCNDFSPSSVLEGAAAGIGSSVHSSDVESAGDLSRDASDDDDTNDGRQDGDDHDAKRHPLPAAEFPAFAVVDAMLLESN